MKCKHCSAEIFWNSALSTWEDNSSPIARQYCWIDPQLGSQLHESTTPHDLTRDQKLMAALHTIATYPTKSTDAAVLAMQRMAQEALR